MVRTVTGELRAAELGAVALGESIVDAVSGWEFDPSITFDRPAAFAEALARLRAFRQAGGGAVVVPGGTLSGREPAMLADLSRAAGIRMIATTGFGPEESLPPHIAGTAAIAWRPGKNAFIDWMKGELQAGMVSGGMLRSGVRAGAISVGTSAGGLRPIEEACVRAAARAALDSGVAVMTEGPENALRVLALLGEEGLPAERVAIGHCDDARYADGARDREIAALGACVCYDHVGWEDAAPHAMEDGRRVDAVRSLIEAGHAGRVLLGCGSIAAGLGRSASRHGGARLLEVFVPRLRQAGVDEAATKRILHDNPARLLGAGGKP